MLYDPSKKLTPKQRTTLKNLNRVRELIEAGWCKHNEYDSYQGQTRYCLEGAIVRAAHYESRPYSELIDLVWSVLPRYAHEAKWSIPDYNDHHDTKKEDVLEVIENARHKIIVGQ